VSWKIDFEAVKYCMECKLDFIDSMMVPAILDCSHNICRDCLERRFNANSDLESHTLVVTCKIDGIKSNLRLPQFYEMDLDPTSS